MRGEYMSTDEKIKVIRIENWSIHGNIRPYQPPWMQTKHIQGVVLNHPRFKMGSKVTTSAIGAFKGRIVHTKSGSAYRMGNVDKAYAEWWRNLSGKEIDPENPITHLVVPE
jgi:hypothetical protein